MPNRIKLADALGSAGLGLIAGGIWLAHGRPAGLTALGICFLMIGAAAYEDDDQ